MVIYKITNLLDGMVYVGQDSKNRSSYFGSGLLIKRAIEKYGKENFKREILEHCNTKEELNQREVYWIKKLNAKENGYNICGGGQGQNHDDIKKRFSETKKGVNNGMFGRKHTDEVKKIVSEKNKGKVRTEEHKQKLRDHILNRNFDQQKKEEIFKKISEKLKGKTKTEEHRLKLSKANLGKTSLRKGAKMS